MSDPRATLRFLQRLSDEDKAEELRDVISRCSCKDLRSFCQTLGVRTRRKKYEAYNSKAGFAELLTKQLAEKSAVKRRDGARSKPLVAEKETYLHLLTTILSDVMPSPLLDELITREQGDASVSAEAHQHASLVRNARAGLPQTRKLQIPNLSAIEKANRLLKEIFPPGSDAATIVAAELARSLEYVEAIYYQDDGDGDESDR
ncbi:uncharacterized protein IUM83_09338 [Phytophthora cinnamomi]|uniref:uncharacterized protein n=1 Tax=Phytophthora cinnamomi TaxID=4785 RepID=UPI0035595A8D|nr:hypothetical protein IUM83_09338 [Phytophthora cinnamomi]